ncbi:MAG: hypothetical protein WCT03_07000 [Candidatus Obscuribacterales bacterium]|jgi:hypothetical protein
MASGSEKLDWAKCKDAFCDDDGSLRDIYVFDTGIDDWNKMLQLLRRKLYGMTFFLDGEVTILPAEAEFIFALGSEHACRLSVDLFGLLLNCHFFCRDQIEFDIAPSEVTDEAKFEGIICFMPDLSSELGKTVLLTPENVAGAVLFRAVPGCEVASCFEN